MKKCCTKSKKEKDVGEFHKMKKNKDGLNPYCKSCRKIVCDNYKKNNPDKRKESANGWYHRNREVQLEKKRLYRIENNEEVNAISRKNYQKYKVKRAVSRKKYNDANKEKNLKYNNKYRIDRKKRDPVYKLKITIRTLMYKTIKECGYSKNSKSETILGCSWDEFVNHLNNNDYGFKVGDDGLDLDHLVAISTAKTKEEVYALNHYTNFQLLPSEYNRTIKRDNEWDADDFNEWYKKTLAK